MRTNPYPSTPCPKIFAQLNQHCVINQYYSHIGRVIVDPIQVDLVSRAIFFRGVALTSAIQAKDGHYLDQFPTEMFFHVIVEVFGCLHQ